jgi:hypothetical protein
MSDQKPDAGELAKKLSELESKNKELEADNFKYRDEIRGLKT